MGKRHAWWQQRAGDARYRDSRLRREWATLVLPGGASSRGLGSIACDVNYDMVRDNTPSQLLRDDFDDVHLHAQTVARCVALVKARWSLTDAEARQIVARTIGDDSGKSVERSFRLNLHRCTGLQ